MIFIGINSNLKCSASVSRVARVQLRAHRSGTAFYINANASVGLEWSLDFSRESSRVNETQL